VDGIAEETLKLATYAPDSHFGKSLLELINDIWTTKCVPKQWCSSAVVSILRKGDVTVMDSYRGISIVGALTKLLMTVVTQRLQDVCQTNKVLRRWQGEFGPWSFSYYSNGPTPGRVGHLS
jgi:hypothetical protein